MVEYKMRASLFYLGRGDLDNVILALDLECVFSFHFCSFVYLGNLCMLGQAPRLPFDSGSSPP